MVFGKCVCFFMCGGMNCALVLQRGETRKFLRIREIDIYKVFYLFLENLNYFARAKVFCFFDLHMYSLCSFFVSAIVCVCMCVPY